MKISEKLKKDYQPISFEVFPPKIDTAFENIKKSVCEIASLKPDFMSVTYGAGGGTSAYTADLASMIKNELGVTALAHLTCASTAKADIKRNLDRLKNSGIENILALRGDLPENFDRQTGDCYEYASQLVSFIKEYGDFCVGGACYPEGHPECESVDRDIENLKHKVSCGADFLITQLFFDNEAFYSFSDKAVKKGVEAPIIAGIMPITSIKQVDRICALSGTRLPAEVVSFLDRYKDDAESLMKAGLDFAIDQINGLLSHGAAGIHIYTMNKPFTAKTVLRGIKR